MVKNIRKKLLKTIFLIAIIVMIIIPKQEIAASNIMLGDINDDKIVDSRDMLYILRHIATKVNKKHPEWELKEEKLEAADVTKDEKVDAEDMLLVLRYIAASNSETIKNKHPEWIEFKKKETVKDTKEQETKEEGKTKPEQEQEKTKQETKKEQDTKKEETKKQEEQTTKPETKTIEVTGIKIDKTKLEIEEGKTEKIIATIEPKNATNKEVTYSSDNEKVATVDENGNVKGVSDGTAKITAKSNNGKTATCEVTVKTKIIEVEKIEINKKSIELDMSGTKTVTLKATITPNTATDKTITWSSSNTKVATVDKKSGKVTATKNGTTVITATANNGKKAECKVTVKTKEIEATEIKVSRTDATLKTSSTGNTTRLVSIILPYNVTKRDVEWTNSNPASVAIEKEIEAGTYYLKTALDDNKVIDIRGSGAKVQIYNKQDIASQQFIITKVEEGYYTIKSKKSNKVLDVKNGGQTAGTIVQEYQSNGTDAQKWEFEYAGNGYYYIKSKWNGLYLDVKGGKSDNGTQIQVYTENRSKAQKFKLEVIKKNAIIVEEATYYLKTALDNNKVVEVKGGSKENDVKIQINKNSKSNGQKFELLSVGNNYYIIRAKCSNRAFDVPNGTKTSGTQIQQHYLNGTDAQIWKLESAGNGYYYIKSKCNGLYLDVKGGKTTNGTAIQVQTGNKSNAQKFKLEKTGDTINKNISIVTIKSKGTKDAKGTITAKTTNGKTATFTATIKKSALDFSYKGNGKVKSNPNMKKGGNFSSETLKIVENHLYDVNAQNFKKVIKSYGGFTKYAQSLGGVFGQYYGKTITGRTEYDFQMAAEYVLGWMFMYGWDYAAVHENLSGIPANGCHAQWGFKSKSRNARGYTADAFYANGGFKRKFVPDWPKIAYIKQPDNTNFDNIISGKNGVDGMASECGDIVGFTYRKMGLKTKKRIKKITRLKDLKVGDSIGYSGNGGGHMNMVGEVYADCIVLYDAGRYMQGNLYYKREIKIPKENTKAADDRVIKNTIGFPNWEGSRWYNFKK